MKNLIFLFFFFAGLVLHLTTYGQTSIEITGIVKSSDGAVQGAQVEFYDLKDEFLGNCVTGPNGRFISERRIAIGKTVKLKVKKPGYTALEKNTTVPRSGDVGEFMLQSKSVIITGTVRDSTTELALQDAEISYYDQSGLPIQGPTTNSSGKFDLTIDFVYGQRITVMAHKAGYFDIEQTMTITSEGRNTMQDFLLPDIASRGLRAFIRVHDKKSGKPLAGVTVQYLDQRKKTYVDTLLSAKGEVELKLYQKPGSVLDFRLSRPGYVTIPAQRTLSEEPRENVFTYEMEKGHRSALGTVLLIGGGTSALVSGGMLFSSNSKYNSYKDFGNEHREDDYNKAKQQRTIAIAAGGVAAGALIAYIIYKVSEKNKEKALLQKKTHIGFIQSVPLNTSYAMGNTPVIGIAYKF